MQDGDPALMEAANENHDEVVSLLIEAGADMDKTDDVSYAAFECFADIDECDALGYSIHRVT